MIDSALFSKSVYKTESDIFSIEDFKPEAPIIESQKVNRSVLYHFYHSYIKFIYDNSKMSTIEKVRSCQQFGFDIGYKFAEEESQGFVKSFAPKVGEKNPKPFIAEMKLLYTRIWTTTFDSTAKLFAIVSENASYKIEDKDFAFTKAISAVNGSGVNDTEIKNYKTLLYEFTKGVIEGFLHKFGLKAEVVYNQNSENSIYYEVKEITKKGAE